MKKSPKSAKFFASYWSAFLQQFKNLHLRGDRFVMLTVAGLINAFGVSVFLYPVNLYDSGISGTAMLLAQITPDWCSLSLILLLLNVPLFLFVGRLMWYKGLHIILDALRALREQGQDFRMVFIGAGGDEKEVRAEVETLRLSDRCFFTGSIADRETLRAWYSRADLFLFPSTFETVVLLSKGEIDSKKVRVE